jgi:hypothetical protein
MSLNSLGHVSEAMAVYCMQTSPRPCGIFRSGNLTGMCGEVEITRGPPSGWLCNLISDSRYRINFSASMTKRPFSNESIKNSDETNPTASP